MRRLIKIRFAVTLLALLIMPTWTRAQATYDSPSGRVEVLGLKRWTLAMLQDSIRRYAPGQELHDAACIVTLRDSLHFVEASVEHFEMAPPGQPRRSYLTIKVIEPQDSSLVRWDVRPRNEFSAALPSYAPVMLPLTDSAGGVQRGRLLFWLQFPQGADREAAALRRSPTARADEKLVSDFLSGRIGEADRVRAMKVLARDGYWANRMVAAAVLSNFATHDSTWLALAVALRDPHEAVREAASMALRGLPSRPVAWRPVVNDLRLLLNGTNLSAITSVFDMLARTEVAAELAPALLRNNAHWILEHLASGSPMAAEAAHRLLVQLHGGRDLGKSREVWQAWITLL